MITDIPTSDRFEERLLGALLDEFGHLATTKATTSTRSSGSTAPHRFRRPSHGLPVAGAIAAAAALVVAGVATFDSNGGNAARPTVRVAQAGSGLWAAGAAHTVLYRLASASASAPSLQGRFVVLSESDTETGYAGVNKRTSVIDTETGASTTYQQAYPVNGEAPSPDYIDEPATLREGPDVSSTEAWFSKLSTDPTALRAQLLTLAEQQQEQVTAEMQQRAAKLGTTLPTPSEQPQLSDDDYVYQEADTLLWSPLVQPALRSALYKVLADTPGFTIDSDATDPAGRSAIAMSRTYDGTSETDVTYEDPATGVVLAQVWRDGNDVITAVYGGATASNTVPPDPYSN